MSKDLEILNSIANVPVTETEFQPLGDLALALVGGGAASVDLG